jgi:hypothetical protein
MSPTRHDLNCFFPRNCTHATRARYLVHAEREILIFLYFKKDGSPLDPDTITSYEKVTREFLDIIKRKFPGEITRQGVDLPFKAAHSLVSDARGFVIAVSLQLFRKCMGLDVLSTAFGAPYPFALQSLQSAHGYDALHSSCRCSEGKHGNRAGSCY